MIDIQLFTNNHSRARVFSFILERILTVPKKIFWKKFGNRKINIIIKQVQRETTTQTNGLKTVSKKRIKKLIRKTLFDKQ